MSKKEVFYTTSEELSNVEQYTLVKDVVEEGDITDTVYRVTVEEVGTIERTLVLATVPKSRKRKGK